MEDQFHLTNIGTYGRPGRRKSLYVVQHSWHRCQRGAVRTLVICGACAKQATNFNRGHLCLLKQKQEWWLSWRQSKYNMKSGTFGLFGAGGRKKLDAHCVARLKNTGYNPQNFSRPYPLMSEINHPDIVNNIPRTCNYGSL